MNTYLRYILPAYCIVYFLFLFFIRAWGVRKKIGKNPVLLSFSDDIHGLIGKYFTAWMLLLGIYSILYCLFPSGYYYFLPMNYLQNDGLEATGLIVLAVSLIWTYAAQGNMRGAWRVGFDEDQKTELVTNGIFRFSRNPIYLGMIVSTIGLFLVTPNGFTLLLAVVGYILIQVQVRMEEEFLLKMHGQSYLDYKASVRRFI